MSPLRRGSRPPPLPPHHLPNAAEGPEALAPRVFLTLAFPDPVPVPVPDLVPVPDRDPFRDHVPVPDHVPDPCEPSPGLRPPLVQVSEGAVVCALPPPPSTQINITHEQ